MKTGGLYPEDATNIAETLTTFTKIYLSTLKDDEENKKNQSDSGCKDKGTGG
jgi:hypothetical protein